MWPCYGVHITVCMARLVFVLCHPEHSCIEPSLHGLDFFLEIFLWRLLYSFVNRLLLFCTRQRSICHLAEKDVWEYVTNNSRNLQPYSEVKLGGVSGLSLTVHGHATVNVCADGHDSLTTDILAVS